MSLLFKILIFYAGALKNLICDHMLAPEYYIASIQPKCSMEAYPCSSAEEFARGSCLSCNGQCPTIGYNAVNSKGSASGKHFLYLDITSPHCGKYESVELLQIFISRNHHQVIAIIIITTSNITFTHTITITIICTVNETKQN